MSGNSQQFRDQDNITSTGMYHYKEGGAQALSGSASTVLSPTAHVFVVLAATAPTLFAVGVTPAAGEHQHPGGIIAFAVKAGEKVWVDGDAILSELD